VSAVEEIEPRDALAEARAVRGGDDDDDVRVLEPAPPAVGEPPWFADDPTDGRPLDWSTQNAVAGSWREERWLGPFARLGPLPEGFAATRLALHRLAERTISPARAAVNGRIGLRWTLGGFGTPFFGADEQLRVERGALVHQRAARATRTAPAEDVDAACASALGEFYGFATSVLEALRAANPGAEPSRVQLWPEHFDIAVEIGAELEERRAGYGASPGDEHHPQPYLYVLPWGETPSSPRWQADGFTGAELGYEELISAADQRALALDFFASRLAELLAR